MESISSATTVFVTPKSADMAESAGATIDEETGDMNVNEEIMPVAAHLRLVLQF